MSRTTFYNVWYGAQEALGDDFKKRDEKKGKDVYKFRPHDLKRTFIADSYDLGHDRAEIKARTGNVSDPVYDGYFTDRQSRKHVEERRQKRKELYEAQNHSEQQIVDLAAEVEAGIWDSGLDELELVIKKKKAEIEGLKITDEDVDI